jgi:beta-phosphoglucomutase
MSDSARRPFSAVLFDMDGVVVRNTIELHLRVWAEFARRHGVQPTESQLRSTNGRRAAEIIDEWLGPGLPDSQLAELVSARETFYQERLRAEALEPVAGLREFLEILRERRIRRALVTSAVPISVEIVLGQLGLANAFEAIVTAEDVTQGKPHPAPYLAGAARLGVSAEQCMIVDDAPTGIRAGKAAGGRCLGLTTSVSAAELAAVGADWIAADFTRLPPALKTLCGG